MMEHLPIYEALRAAQHHQGECRRNCLAPDRVCFQVPGAVSDAEICMLNCCIALKFLVKLRFILISSERKVSGS